jgi:hypothetical protein
MNYSFGVSSGPINSQPTTAQLTRNSPNPDEHPLTDLPPGFPTVDQINKALAETGERERLKSLLKAKLWECGWHEQLKAECQAELRRRGVDKIGPHELAASLEAKAKGKSVQVNDAM